jgi:type IV pilus assembly protein PilY1
LAKLANSAPAAVVRYVYGGDLLGNVWRFDLEAAGGSAPVRIAALRDPTGGAQPVTSPPVVGPVPGSSTKFYVYVGTGRYFSTDDVPGTSTPNTWATQTQSFYGIIDDTSVSAPTLPNIRGTNGSSCPSNGGNGDFVCQQATQSSAGAPYTATHNAVDLSVKRGFYMDIPIANGRVNTQPALTTRGTLVFIVNKPTNIVCNPGGSSYLFQLSALTGGAVIRTPGVDSYYDAGFFLADALSSRPLLVTTSSGTRAIERMSDKTTQSRHVDETADTAARFRRVYKRALN